MVGTVDSYCDIIMQLYKPVQQSNYLIARNAQKNEGSDWAE